MKHHISVIGIDYNQGFSHQAQNIIENAEIIVGTSRHLSFLKRKLSIKQQSLEDFCDWRKDFDNKIEQIIKQSLTKKIVILASGNPMFFGIGSSLVSRIKSNITVLPAPSIASIIAAKLNWDLTKTQIVSLLRRPEYIINRYIFPDRRIIILSKNQNTPPQIIKLLKRRGFEKTIVRVFENIGSSDENIYTCDASQDLHEKFAELNALAIECVSGENPIILPDKGSIDNRYFVNDGMISSQEQRSATIAALKPQKNQLLWDVGAASGSISIEWLNYYADDNRVFAIESDAKRCLMIKQNAYNFGLDNIEVINAIAPQIFPQLPKPQAIFLGTNVSSQQMIEKCWERLDYKGRLVANAVTIEGENTLLEFWRKHKGKITRMQVSNADKIGTKNTFRPMLAITRYCGIKK